MFLSDVQQPVGANQASRKLHVLHHSETPCSTYAIIESGTKQVSDYYYFFLAKTMSSSINDHCLLLIMTSV